MTNFLDKWFSSVLSTLFTILLVAIWIFPVGTLIYWMLFMFCVIFINILFIGKKYRNAYLENQISRIDYLWKFYSQTFYLLLILILAGLVGRFLAGIISLLIDNKFALFTTSILVALFSGVCISFLFQKMQASF